MSIKFDMVQINSPGGTCQTMRDMIIEYYIKNTNIHTKYFTSLIKKCAHKDAYIAYDKIIKTLFTHQIYS
jgi:membrane-bound ClpP family serine protease